MGVVFGYLRVSPVNANLLRQHPILIHRYLGLDGEKRPTLRRSGGLLSRFFGHKKPAPLSRPLEPLTSEPRMPGDEDDADKAWQAIHYLITGAAEGGTYPTAFILYGGTEVGKEDVGLGPARLFTPEQTREINAVLSPLTRETLHARYDGPAMDKAMVYPQIWTRDGENGFEYVWDCFARLQNLVHTAARRNECLLVYFC